MSIPKYGARRDKSEKGIVDALKEMGVTVYRLDRPCDLLLGFRGKTYLAECKTGSKGYGKGLNDNQSDFQDNWRGGELIVLRNAQDALEWVNSRSKV